MVLETFTMIIWFLYLNDVLKASQNNNIIKTLSPLCLMENGSKIAIRVHGLFYNLSITSMTKH